MKIRLVKPEAAAEMADLINAIIAQGGTTAYEVPFTPLSMAENYITAPALICCHVAEAAGIQGFQALWHDASRADWAVIATFARLGTTQRGIGSALFEATKTAARAAGKRTIDATIRADNTGGIAFYTSRGFVDYDRQIGVPLRDGTPVDRVRKRYDL